MRKAIVIEYDDVKTFEAMAEAGAEDFGARIFSVMADPSDWRDAVALGAVYEVRAGPAPVLSPGTRDAMWNRLALALLEQGFDVDPRDHPAIRAAGRVVIPLGLIGELWDIAHGRGDAAKP